MTTDDLMTPAEHRAMELTAELYNLICNEIIGRGPSRAGDVDELVADIHRLQHRILRQAAARAYPDRYRLLGGPPPPGPAEPSTRPARTDTDWIRMSDPH
jgi:hypothetical protein